VLEVDGGVDYRLRALEHLRTYWWPLGADAERGLAEAFEAMSSGADESPHLAVDGRTLEARRVAGGQAWFDFVALCAGPRSQRDYLELARRFNTVLVSGVPRMTPSMANEARRFTWMVDIFYDHRVKLLLAAEVAPEELYREGANSREFARTLSRLTEMQSHEYMALAHDPAELAPAREGEPRGLTEVKVRRAAP
jgi:cell division protein ZapE